MHTENKDPHAQAALQNVSKREQQDAAHNAHRKMQIMLFHAAPPQSALVVSVSVIIYTFVSSDSLIIGAITA